LPGAVWNDDFLDPFVPLQSLAERQESGRPELPLCHVKGLIGGLQLPLAKQLVDLRPCVGQCAFMLRRFFRTLPCFDLLSRDALDLLAQLLERRRDDCVFRLEPGEACNRFLRVSLRRLAARDFHGCARPFVLERLRPQSRPPLAKRGERRPPKLLLRAGEHPIRSIEFPASHQFVQAGLRCLQRTLLLRRVFRALRRLRLLAREPFRLRVRFRSLSSDAGRFVPQIIQRLCHQFVRRPETREARNRRLMPARRKLPARSLDRRACPLVL
jgi:hypothetical protein